MFRNLYAEEARHNQTNITMGKMLGINPVTYSRKKKDGNFTIAEAKKLTEFFGVSFEYLFKTELIRFHVINNRDIHDFFFILLTSHNRVF